MTDVNALTKVNQRRWDNAKITRGPEFSPVAKRLVAAKDRYLGISAKTGVPWFAIAVIHEREASQRFDRQLGQGDPLSARSVHDPKGRGPFATFEAGAIDALTNCGPYAARWRDWSAGGTMTLLEQYNGLGYAAKGAASPYVWSGTDRYRSGKYIRDHVYDPNVVDSQLGCAGLILAMQAIDASIQFGKPDATAPVVVKTGQAVVTPHPAAVPAKPSTPSVTNPAPGSIGAFIASIFNAIFKRK